MGAVFISPKLSSCPQVRKAGPAAVGFWIRAVCYASTYCHDTMLVDHEILKVIGGKRWKSTCNLLVQAGMAQWDQGNLRMIRWRIGAECAYALVASGNSLPWSRAAYPEVYARDGHQCRYCGSECATDPTIDHVIPRCQGGNDGPDNLVVCCRPCNLHKSGRTPEQAGMVLQ